MTIAKIVLSDNLSITLTEDTLIDDQPIELDDFENECRLLLHGDGFVSIDNKQNIYYFNKNKILYIKTKSK
ncbi:MAG: hypothetical protein ACLUVC_00150 [Longibaculum sp.]